MTGSTMDELSDELPKCNCLSSRCLKMYCNCFKHGVPCNGCACFNCGNTPDVTALSVKRYRAIVTSDSTRSRQSESTKETFTKAISGKPGLCHCKNSNCLKLYCICFKEGRKCNGCACVNCMNTQSNAAGVEARRKHTLAKDPTAFDVLTEDKGCKCVKSQCIRKYCECFAAGRKCISICQCVGCCNPHGVRSASDSMPPPAVKDLQVQQMRAPLAKRFQRVPPPLSPSVDAEDSYGMPLMHPISTSDGMLPRHNPAHQFRTSSPRELGPFVQSRPHGALRPHQIDHPRGAQASAPAPARRKPGRPRKQRAEGPRPDESANLDSLLAAAEMLENSKARPAPWAGSEAAVAVGSKNTQAAGDADYVPSAEDDDEDWQEDEQYAEPLTHGGTVLPCVPPGLMPGSWDFMVQEPPQTSRSFDRSAQYGSRLANPAWEMHGPQGAYPIGDPRGWHHADEGTVNEQRWHSTPRRGGRPAPQSVLMHDYDYYQDSRGPPAYAVPDSRYNVDPYGYATQPSSRTAQQGASMRHDMPMKRRPDEHSWDLDEGAAQQRHRAPPGYRQPGALLSADGMHDHSDSPRLRRLNLPPRGRPDGDSRQDSDTYPTSRDTPRSGGDEQQTRDCLGSSSRELSLQHPLRWDLHSGQWALYNKDVAGQKFHMARGSASPRDGAIRGRAAPPSDQHNGAAVPAQHRKDRQGPGAPWPTKRSQLGHSTSNVDVRLASTDSAASGAPGGDVRFGAASAREPASTASLMGAHAAHQAGNVCAAGEDAIENSGLQAQEQQDHHERCEHAGTLSNAAQCSPKQHVQHSQSPRQHASQSQLAPHEPVQSPHCGAKGTLQWHHDAGLEGGIAPSVLPHNFAPNMPMRPGAGMPRQCNQ